MKKLLSVLLIISMLCMTAAFVSCTQPADDQNNDGQIVDNQGTSDDVQQPEVKKIVVGVDDQIAPMAFRDENNNITGFDIDYLTAVAEEMGYEIEFQGIDWSSKFMELESGKIDIIASGFTIDDERKEQCNITNPYLANSQIIVVAASSEIAVKADLTDKVVGVQTDSTAINALNKDEISSAIAQQVEYPDNVSILNDVKVGRLDAAVLDATVANYYATIEPDAFKILEESLAPEEYGFAVKKGNDDFSAKLQAGIDAVNESGKAAEISTKWFGSDIVLK